MFTKKFASKLAVLGAAGLASASAFAVDPPATAVALAQAVDISDAKNAGLVIAGLMISAGVVLWGARLVMSKFRPKV